MRSTCVNVYKVHVTRSFNDSTGMLIMCDLRNNFCSRSTKIISILKRPKIQ